MFIAVLVNFHLVRRLMIGGCIRLMSVIVITGLQILGDAVEFSVNLDDNEWRVVSRRRSMQDRRTLGQCAKCGETNHVTARCKHAEHVQFRRCGKLGHKDKHHAYD